MNVKYYAYTACIIFFINTSALFSMNRVAFYRGMAVLPCLGAMNAYANYKDIQTPIKGTSIKGKTRDWAHNIMKKCNAPIMPFLYGTDWAVANDSVLLANEPTVNQIEKALSTPNPTLDEQKLIAVNKMLLMHELKHRISGDSHKKMYALLWIPTVIQAAASITRHAFYSLSKTPTPQGKFNALFMANLALKLTVWERAEIIYARYLEKKADEFACNNADSPLELEAFAQLWRAHEETILASPDFAPIRDNKQRVAWHYFWSGDDHPYSGDRAAMTEDFIQEWNTKKVVKRLQNKTQ